MNFSSNSILNIVPDFKHDPYAGGSPWGAICSRGDLVPNSPVADGCYDTKVKKILFLTQRQKD